MVDRKLLPTPKTPSGGPERQAAKTARGSGAADLEGAIKDLEESDRINLTRYREALETIRDSDEHSPYYYNDFARTALEGP